MNKRLSFTLLLTTSLLLSGCNKESKYLDKTDNTNLEFWITQKVTFEDLKDCTFIPGGFGVDRYLDSRYEPVPGKNEYSNVTIPSKYVTYSVTAYPDYSSHNGSYITSIDITDSSINVYGLTINSNKEEIYKVMVEDNKFKDVSKDAKNVYYKNNCTFYFTSSKISISAYVTNSNNLIF